MPGTTYPPNVYPGQAQAQSQSTSYVYQRIPDMLPIHPPAMASQVQNPNIPHRRLTPNNIDSNVNSDVIPTSHYSQRNLYPSLDTSSVYPQPNNLPIPVPSLPYPYPPPHPSFAYFNTNHFTNRRGMFSYHAVAPQNLASWNSNVPAIQPLPVNINFPPPPPQLPLPQLPYRHQRSTHKVWILDCKSCGIFLSNRGMKAVLLLHQTVSLFSTDALPINCSAYSSNPDVLRPTTALSPLPAQNPPLPRPTCECLTQTLCCHGCGGMVGYMIVSPCSRCITSTTHNNRQTNGHRFVFHASEVIASVRHYVPDEPGVLPFDVDIDTVPSFFEPPPPPLSSPIPLSDPSPTESLPRSSAPGLIGSRSASSSGSGSGLSGLFFTAGEEGERTEVSWGRGRGGEVGRGGSRFMDPRDHQLQVESRGHWPTVAAVSSPLQLQPDDGASPRYPSISPPRLVGLSPSTSSEEEGRGGHGQAGEDDGDGPPSLVASSDREGEGIGGFRYPFYGVAIPDRPQSQSPPPPQASLTSLNSVPTQMTIPVPSSVYPRPVQHTLGPHSHATHSLPFPSPSSSFSSPSAPSPSPMFSTNPSIQEKDQVSRRLRKGDILYWHHLQRSGEIPPVGDDERARIGNGNGRSEGSGSNERAERKENEGEDLGTVLGGR